MDLNTILSFVIIDEDIRERKTRHTVDYVARVLNEYSEDEWISDFRMNKATYSYIKQTVEECWTGYIGVDQALL